MDPHKPINPEGVFNQTSDTNSGVGIIRNYFRDVWTIITKPTQFYRAMPVTGGIGGPLAFALVTHWIGAALESLWKLWMFKAFEEHLKGFLQMLSGVAEVDHPGRGAMVGQLQEKLGPWIWGVGSVIIDPFTSLMQIFMSAAVIYCVARLLVSPSTLSTDPAQAPRPEVSFESIVRIICFGMTPALLAGVPLIGGMMASMLAAICTIVGVREVFRISTGRAVMIAVAPSLLILAAVMFIAVALFTVFFSVVS